LVRRSFGVSWTGECLGEASRCYLIASIVGHCEPQVAMPGR
jgi:hypothetical protein